VAKTASRTACCLVWCNEPCSKSIDVAEEDFRFPHTDLIESFVRESYAVSGCFLSHLVDCSIRASENFLLRYFAETGFFNFHRCQDAVAANTQSIKENTRSGDAQFLWASDCAVRVFLRTEIICAHLFILAPLSGRILRVETRPAASPKTTPEARRSPGSPMSLANPLSRPE
jgi:hypothetical protein